MRIIENFMSSALIIALMIGGRLALWRLSKDAEHEVKCPGCGKSWAAENSGEELIGMFRKSQPRIFQRRGLLPFGDSDVKMVWYEKYRIHYKCKLCGYEWELLKSRKQ
jgi:hypothetical protein